MIPNTLFFLKVVLTLQRLVPFYINFRINPIVTTKKIWHFDRNWIKPMHQSKENWNLSVHVSPFLLSLIWIFHQRRKLIFIFLVFIFKTTKSCTCFLKCISKYFIFFGVIVPLILVSKRSSLVYRNVIKFYMLILYPVTLLDSLISSRIFLCIRWNFLSGQLNFL